MNNSPKLFIIIGDTEISLITGYIGAQNNFKLLEKLILPVDYINGRKITDLDKSTNLIKRNIISIEQKMNYTFKDIILILNNLEVSFLNLCGFTKLNGTQIQKANITYILNSLKSCVEEFEKDKKIFHIFNSEYCLDKKKLDNLPIGLFGDFYSQELSFCMINKNYYKNLKAIFDNCNIKIKKIISNNFVKGTMISDTYLNVNTFFHIQLNENDSKIFYFENDSFKYEQSFKFGTKLILKDIAKVTSLSMEIIAKLIEKNSNIDILGEELIEKEHFINQNFRKIKKGLITKIAEARIIEFLEILLFKNINCQKLLNKTNHIYLEIDDQKNYNCFKKVYLSCTYFKSKFNVKVLKRPNLQSLINATCKIIQFGWKKEAIPVTKEDGSYFVRILRSIFS